MNVVVFAIVLLSALGIVYRQLMSQLGEIHVLVNSNLTKVQADLTIALQRIEILESALTRERD